MPQCESRCHLLVPATPESDRFPRHVSLELYPVSKVVPQGLFQVRIVAQDTNTWFAG
jgi:hypothetical protein